MNPLGRWAGAALGGHGLGRRKKGCGSFLDAVMAEVPGRGGLHPYGKTSLADGSICMVYCDDLEVVLFPDTEDQTHRGPLPLSDRGWDRSGLKGTHQRKKQSPLCRIPGPRRQNDQSGSRICQLGRRLRLNAGRLGGRR